MNTRHLGLNLHGKYYMQINWDFHLFDPTRICRNENTFIIESHTTPISDKSVIHFYISKWNFDLYLSDKVVAFMQKSIPAKFIFHSCNMDIDSIKHLILLYTEPYELMSHEMDNDIKPFRRVYCHTITDKNPYIMVEYTKSLNEIRTITLDCDEEYQSFSINIKDKLFLEESVQKHSWKAMWDVLSKLTNALRYDRNTGFQSTSIICGISGSGRKIRPVFIIDSLGAMTENAFITESKTSEMSDDSIPIEYYRSHLGIPVSVLPELPVIDETSLLELPYLEIEKDSKKLDKTRWTRPRSNDKHYF